MERKPKPPTVKQILGAIAEQQDALAGEVLALRKAITVMAALMPISADEAIRAWEVAVALEDNATEATGNAAYIQQVELETIREVLGALGLLRRTPPSS